MFNSHRKLRYLTNIFNKPDTHLTDGYTVGMVQEKGMFQSLMSNIRQLVRRMSHLHLAWSQGLLNLRLIHSHLLYTQNHKHHCYTQNPRKSKLNSFKSSLTCIIIIIIVLNFVIRVLYIKHCVNVPSHYAATCIPYTVHSNICCGVGNAYTNLIL